MTRTLHDMFLVLARLPFLVRLLIGAAIAGEFVVITEWERLNFHQWSRFTFSQLAALPPAKVTIAPKQPEPRSFDFPEISTADKNQAAAISAALAKRMNRVVIADPKIETNGSIINDGQILYLYGIKLFDTKKVCTRSSGTRWACGLHAYAKIRNAVAAKLLVCDPKKIIQNGVSAVCRVGTTDVALTLVRDGLAELEENVEDAELVTAQVFAKNKNLGIWDR